MLYNRSPKDKTRRGLIIDFDYSSEIGDEGDSSDNHRTVCLFEYKCIPITNSKFSGNRTLYGDRGPNQCRQFVDYPETQTRS